jgi:hypothetical protein
MPFASAVRALAFPQVRWVVALNNVVKGNILLEMSTFFAGVRIPAKMHHAAAGWANFQLVSLLPCSPINHGEIVTRQGGAADGFWDHN